MLSLSMQPQHTHPLRAHLLEPCQRLRPALLAAAAVAAHDHLTHGRMCCCYSLLLLLLPLLPPMQRMLQRLSQRRLRPLLPVVGQCCGGGATPRRAGGCGRLEAHISSHSGGFGFQWQDEVRRGQAPESLAALEATVAMGRELASSTC
eukprot:365861-Chlamydomonas_euryale.AAC.14